MRFDDAQVVGASVARVGTQMSTATKRCELALDHDGAEHLIEALAVVDVSRSHDERQLDATAVHQEVTFGFARDVKKAKFSRYTSY